MKQVPPQDLDLERSILATVLIDPETLDEISDILKPSDFYRTVHQQVYQSYLDLNKYKQKPELALILNALKGKVDNPGTFLSKLMNDPVVTHVESACNKLCDLSALRHGIKVANNYLSKAHDANGNATHVVDTFQREVLGIDMSGGVSRCEPCSSILENYIDELEASKGGGELTGHPTGFYMLDQLTSGWQGSDLIVLAARPAMGKTALALRFGKTMASDGIPGLFFSLEMAKKQLMMRLVAMTARINTNRLRSRKLWDEDWSKVTDACQKIDTLPIFIDDSSALHYSQVRRIARRMKKRHKIEWVIIDYLQLMKGDFHGSKVQEIGTITSAMKQLAKELEIPIILLSQLSRNVENRDNKRPRLSDLRDSGEIEQDADLVISIYRDEVYNGSEDNPKKGTAEINILKHRNGSQGMVETAWIGPYTRFEPLAKDW